MSIPSAEELAFLHLVGPSSDSEPDAPVPYLEVVAVIGWLVLGLLGGFLYGWWVTR